MNDSFVSWWPLLALAWPAAMLLACLFQPLRVRMTGLLWLAPIPGLAAACLASGSPAMMFDWAPYRIMLKVDAPGALLLGTAALLWIAAGLYAGEYLRGDSNRGRFAICWLFTLIGSLGIFLAADLASFLLFYALVSLPAYGMIIHRGTHSTQCAGSIYIGFALLGEGVLLLAFVMLASIPHGGGLRIADIVGAIPAAPSRNVILPLLIAGFGMKMALVPLHFWMPLTYTAAPIPAAAVLSGAAVKAGVIGLIRFLPFGVAVPEWGHLLVAVGLTGAFAGVGLGLTQTNPKTVLAYSSVSQMGFLAALFGMGLSAGDDGAGMVAAFYAAHHVLVKGALFLAIGLGAVARKSRFGPVVLWPAALIALGLAGLPLTGGALAKLAAKGPLGYGLVGTLATWSAAGTALLMFHFLGCLRSSSDPDGKTTVPLRLVLPWLGLVAAAVVVPWITYPLGGIGSINEVIAPSALWKVLWPLLVGGMVALFLRRWGRGLPQIPSGDIAVFGSSVSRIAARLGLEFERMDEGLRRWFVAGLSLVIVTIILGAAMFAAQ